MRADVSSVVLAYAGSGRRRSTRLGARDDGRPDQEGVAGVDRERKGRRRPHPRMCPRRPPRPPPPCPSVARPRRSPCAPARRGQGQRISRPVRVPAHGEAAAVRARVRTGRARVRLPRTRPWPWAAVAVRGADHAARGHGVVSAERARPPAEGASTEDETGVHRPRSGRGRGRGRIHGGRGRGRGPGGGAVRGGGRGRGRGCRGGRGCGRGRVLAAEAAATVAFTTEKDVKNVVELHAPAPSLDISRSSFTLS